MSVDAAEPALPFISYAQNFEDVILWRALKHIPSGFYIDVGAQDPVIDSVSMTFYEHGWRGINVEPNSYYAKKIRDARPDEQVIEAAISLKEGSIPFFNVEDTGLSTADVEIARKHRRDGFEVQLVEVPCMRLSEVFDNLPVKDVHWLKIDVEGLEREVLLSWEPSPVRPWIVLLESTEPNSPTPNFHQWEDLLINLGYEFVYFDGLNRFYISQEHLELREFFGVGANVFDKFFLSELSPGPCGQKLVARIRDAHHQVEALKLQAENQHREAENRFRQIEAEKEAEKREAENRYRQIEAEKDAEKREAENRYRQIEAEKEAEKRGIESLLQNAELRIAQLYSSRSWRITWPIRAFTKALRWLCKGSYAWLTLKPGSRPRRTIGCCLRKIINQIHRHPRLRSFLILRLRRFPQLDKRLRAFVRKPSIHASLPPQTTMLDISPHAQKIYNLIYTK